MPDLRKQWRSLLRGGISTSAVIVAYLLPPLLLFWLLAVRDWSDFGRLAPPIAAFCGLVILLPPVAIPILPPLYLAHLPELSMGPLAASIIAGWIAVTVFILPSAFLTVSKTGHVRSALRVDLAVLFVLRNPRLYVEAWALSVVATFGCVLLGPLCPWGLFWSYLVILSAFNQALVASRDSVVPAPLRKSALVGGCGVLDH